MVELCQSGLVRYLGSVWNALDWTNYIIFFQVFRELTTACDLFKRDDDAGRGRQSSLARDGQGARDGTRSTRPAAPARSGFSVRPALPERLPSRSGDEGAKYKQSRITKEMGYYDAWEVYAAFASTKFLLATCVCIEILKVIKFTNIIVPKMGLMTDVLHRGFLDLLFFSFVFCICLFAFNMLFFIQLGPFMDDYFSQFQVHRQ